MALFRNLLEAAENDKLLAAAMIGAKIQKTLEGLFEFVPKNLFGKFQVLQEQPLDDEEMEEDLLFVAHKLQEVEQTLSRFLFCFEDASSS